MEIILEWLATTIVRVIETTGYAGIFILMALESANIPVPSEIVMPFSGFLAAKGVFTLWGLILVSSAGNLIGSWVSYEIALRGGRPFLARYGRFVLITQHDLNVADRLFARFGFPIIFFARMLPVVRTFISFPAGIGRMDRGKFLLYTFIGSLPWNFALSYLGIAVGENWKIFEHYFRIFDWFLMAILTGGVIWWIWRHIKILNHEKQNSERKSV